jgi:DNA-binding GntR family transcriptional regulator
MSFERNRSKLILGLRKAITDMEKARSRNDRRGYLRADTSYHEAFFANCGNAYLLETHALHVGKIAALRTHLAVKPQHTDKSFLEHKEIVALLEDSNLSKALNVLDQHIDRTKSTYGAEIEDIAAADRNAESTH